MTIPKDTPDSNPSNQPSRSGNPKRPQTTQNPDTKLNPKVLKEMGVCSWLCLIPPPNWNPDPICKDVEILANTIDPVEIGRRAGDILFDWGVRDSAQAFGSHEHLGILILDFIREAGSKRLSRESCFFVSCVRQNNVLGSDPYFLFLILIRTAAVTLYLYEMSLQIK